MNRYLQFSMKDNCYIVKSGRFAEREVVCQSPVEFAARRHAATYHRSLGSRKHMLLLSASLPQCGPHPSEPHGQEEPPDLHQVGSATTSIVLAHNKVKVGTGQVLEQPARCGSRCKTCSAATCIPRQTLRKLRRLRTTKEKKKAEECSVAV